MTVVEYSFFPFPADFRFGAEGDEIPRSAENEIFSQEPVLMTESPKTLFNGQGCDISVFDFALLDMKDGGVSRIVFDPSLGYGDLQ